MFWIWENVCWVDFPHLGKCFQREFSAENLLKCFRPWGKNCWEIFLRFEEMFVWDIWGNGYQWIFRRKTQEMYVGELSVPGECLFESFPYLGECLFVSFSYTWGNVCLWAYLGKCFVEEFFFELSLILLASSLLLSVPAHWRGRRDSCRSFCQATADSFQNSSVLQNVHKN